ncbi:hypothetical protein ZIOFF_032505 [Zingiber officinale]|uniref:Uncharacterized protein n=1 Tax=Zingiber officinale TaxID=94328 RepID=A0A8J5GGE6_ZINOF|nr:hypothetical protein ZIOFF_032505 [Zingiber officinale]
MSTPSVNSSHSALFMVLLPTGDSLKDSLVAVISVDQDVLKTWAESERIKVVSLLSLLSFQYEDLGKLCNDQRTKAAVLAEMDAVGKQAQATISFCLLTIYI